MSDAEQQTQDQSSQQENTSLFGNLVGDDKKFKTPEDLAKSKVYADEFIETLKAEKRAVQQQLEEAQRELERRKTAEQIAEELRQQATSPTKSATSIDPTEITQLIDQRVEQIQRYKSAKENEAVVEKELINAYGGVAEATKALQNKASELGVPISYLEQLSQTSPKAALKLLIGDNQTQKAPASTAPTGNTNQQPPNTAGKPSDRDAYWAEMRKNNLAEYLSPQNQAIRMQEALQGKA